MTPVVVVRTEMPIAEAPIANAGPTMVAPVPTDQQQPPTAEGQQQQQQQQQLSAEPVETADELEPGAANVSVQVTVVAQAMDAAEGSPGPQAHDDSTTVSNAQPPTPSDSASPLTPETRQTLPPALFYAW